MQIIPAIDIQDGRCVRLRQGRFDESQVYGDDVLGLARNYCEQGASWLHIVDLDAAQGAGKNNLPIVSELAENIPCALQIGGGLREASQLDELFNRGAQRLVIGSRAITHADTVREWLTRFGGERIALALDVRLDDGTPIIMTHGWQRRSDTTLWQALDNFKDAGLKHLLCTDIARDGMLAGPNLALYEQCLARYPALLLQASGGIRSREDIVALDKLGVPFAISGRALLEGTLTIGEAEQC